jgi:hypothetical protein
MDEVQDDRSASTSASALREDVTDILEPLRMSARKYLERIYEHAVSEGRDRLWIGEIAPANAAILHAEDSSTVWGCETSSG